LEKLKKKKTFYEDFCEKYAYLSKLKEWTQSRSESYEMVWLVSQAHQRVTISILLLACKSLPQFLIG
jgi:hypothetical protein